MSHSLNKKEYTYNVNIFVKSNETKVKIILASFGSALKKFYGTVK